MNFGCFDFSVEAEQTLLSLENGGKIPHAIIIEGNNSEKLLEYARFLSMLLVCTSENKPCGKCNQCKKAFDQAHADISYPKPTNKSNTYSVEQIKGVIREAYIIPNEANAKVFIFENADNALSEVVQNALLKTLEEPPKNVYFILLCQSTQKLLITVRSRCSTIRLSDEKQIDGEIVQSSKSIVSGILSLKEYDLMKALTSLESKEMSDEILTTVALILRDGLAISVGAKTELDKAFSENVSARLTKGQIIELIDITKQAQIKIKQNISIQLLTAWLCGEYRRISWQR